MKTLKSILNQKFINLAVVIISLTVLVEYLHLTSTYELHKKRAIESTKILADYFEGTILFESVPDFNSLADKLDFEKTYHGITLLDKNGKTFAFRGENIRPFSGDDIVIKDRRLYTRVDIVSNGKNLGTLYMSFFINQLEKDLLRGALFLILSLLIISFGFYFYILQINQIVISPVNFLIKEIHLYESRENVDFINIKSSVTEINELNETFSSLIEQVNHSKGNLEILNKTLEEKVKYKTQELTEALEETKKFQNKIIAQEKLASLGGLSAGIAHEIKNPLNLIINSSQLVTMKLEVLNKIITKQSNNVAKEDVLEFKEEMVEINEICEIINSSGSRADRIIKGMLSQARSKSSKREEHSLTEICKQGLNLAYHAMRAKEDSISVEIVEKIEEDVLYTCYFEEIERALINLIDNSFDALREKKEMNSQFAPILKVTLIKNNFNIHVSVEDNGAGIPNEIIFKVKEPFFTTKPTGKGTGLGISMINDIVTSQSGEFLIESKLGEYTKMTMIFPLNNRKKEA